jgi:UV DNA damage repair endonuclease
MTKNANDNDNDFEISEESEENIIINLNKLSKMISAFLQHECQRASPSVKVVKRLGNVLHICLIVNHPLFVDIHHHVRQSVKPSL